MNVIPESELKLRHVYSLRSRNLLVGVWQGEGFIGIREKFGNKFLFMESLWKGNGGTARPLQDLAVVPDEIELREYNPTECETCGNPVAFRVTDDVKRTGVWEHSDGNVGHHTVSPISRMYDPLFDFLVPIDRAEMESTL